MYQPLKSDAVAPAPAGLPRRPIGQRPLRIEPLVQPKPPQAVLATITPIVILGWVRRFWLIALVLAVLGAIAGYAAGTIIPPRYTSYSDILLDPNDLQLVADDLYSRAAQGDAQLIDVESKMRILSSISVLGRVVDELNLAENPDFADPADANQAGSDNRLAAIRSLADRVRVSREERSYVVTASAWARTPALSAAITNSLVNAFLVELADADSEGARNASDALNLRLTELRNDAAAAESAVVDYRRANNLPMSSDGQLSTQSAVQINTQVDTARETLIAAEARYAALNSGTASADAQETETLAQLRREYAIAKQKADALAATMGPRHPNLATARAEQTALQGEIDAEVARTVETARTDLQRARDVFDQLSNAAGTQMGNVFTDEQAQLELRQLERTAASSVAIYEAYLTRAQQVAERSQLNTSKVRVISPAVEPIARSYPPRSMVLAAGGFFGGLMLGLALAAALGLLTTLMPQRPRRAQKTRVKAA
ncbi:GumC family protein [Devosia sp. BK]|uniref:GumC family protein n=1 Tax=Devosia sp. BK TaxID=2871706 RepID=UPI00293AD24C|nr:GumC family protein [Devosia sp. BK]MDV3252190.1 GumC family protein [Devosia sp. BK]